MRFYFPFNYINSEKDKPALELSTAGYSNLSNLLGFESKRPFFCFGSNFEINVNIQFWCDRGEIHREGDKPAIKVHDTALHLMYGTLEVKNTAKETSRLFTGGLTLILSIVTKTHLHDKNGTKTENYIAMETSRLCVSGKALPCP